MASLAVGVGQAVSDEPPDAGDVREVQVLDQSDRPLAGATVTVSENPPSDLPEGASFTATVLFSGTTAESGEVNVVVPAVTDAGDVTVTVMKPGYTPSTEMLETADPQEARPAASLAGLAPRPKRVRLTLTRMERPAAKTGMSHARLNALPCYYAPSNYDYLNVQEFREDTRVGKAYSRSERGFVDMTYNRGGTSVLGVGSSADGKVLSFSQAYERERTSDITQPFRALVGKGTAVFRTKVKHIHWRITETTNLRCPNLITTKRTYREIRPEVILGGDDSTYTDAVPDAPSRANCSGNVYAGRPLTVTKGSAETLSAGTTVGGLVTLSARSGHSDQVTITAGAKSGATKPVQICGTRGGPGDPGQVVVVNP